MSARAARRRAEREGRCFATATLDGDLTAYKYSARLRGREIQPGRRRAPKTASRPSDQSTDRQPGFRDYRDEDGPEITRHMRRVRALGFGVRRERASLVYVIKLYPREAALSPAVAVARETFRAAMNDLRKLDIFAEAAMRPGGTGHG
jgi:hypothetical protein